MSGESMNFEELLAEVQLKEKRSRKRRFALYAIPIAAAIFLIYTSTVERLYFSLKYDIPLDQVDLAKEQHEMWVANLTCTGSLQVITLSDGTRVGIQACPSGDILVKLINPDGTKFYRWISRRGLLERGLLEES